MNEEMAQEFAGMTSEGKLARQQAARERQSDLNDELIVKARALGISEETIASVKLNTLRQMVGRRKDSEVFKKEIRPIEFTAESVASERHPDRNEDFYIADNEHGIFAVLDGMGGYAAGDVASRAAGESLHRALIEIPADLPLEEFKRRVWEAVLAANQAIAEKIAQDPDHLSGMGTTLTLVIPRKEKDGSFHAVYCNVGDSRFYIGYSVEGEDKLAQVSRDDDLAGREVGNPSEREKIRNILDNAKTQAELEGVSRRYWENRNVITRAMRGQPDFEPEVSNLRVYPGEKMGITSDGVHDNLRKD